MGGVVKCDYLLMSYEGTTCKIQHLFALRPSIARPDSAIRELCQKAMQLKSQSDQCESMVIKPTKVHIMKSKKCTIKPY
ncbi:hypothetical protein CEXT_755731 [Caerostris extrusa]|uniref:Uncharacterized protein n=1 Tax=Caerostris extrusa TaxID=172846 RepID=A0AAV4TET1_CAEEX|nr:hypothetical protein CEXT_755731 [Caerostris extrusa]